MTARSKVMYLWVHDVQAITTESPAFYFAHLFTFELGEFSS